MRKIKLFEEYREDIHSIIKGSRKLLDTNVMKVLGKLTSFIDDLIHFDFNLIPYSIKNKSGYNKLQELVSELNILKLIIKRSNGDVDFEDLYKYGLNDKVLLYIDDEDVKEYLKKDAKLLNRLNTHEYMNLFSKYSEWKEENGLNESYNFKTINYYSCDNCSNLFKSKEECDTCEECGSDKIVHMDEVEWYRQSE